MHNSVHGRINPMPGLQDDDGPDCAPADRQALQDAVFQVPTMRQGRTARRDQQSGNRRGASLEVIERITQGKPDREAEKDGGTDIGDCVAHVSQAHNQGFVPASAATTPARHRISGLSPRK
jgi:hypothetical protein